MYISDHPKILNSRSTVHLDKSRFTLDASGVAGFFGGTEAASAMATVHLCKNRKLLGWYNSPGSYEIARRYGLLTKFGFFFGGGHADSGPLLALSDLDGRKGPPFLRVHSGTIIPETDHLAAIFMKECPSSECLIKPMDGRQPVRVTIAELDSCPQDDNLRLIPTSCDSLLYAAVPILVSAGTCATCAVNADWYSFSLILLGMIANGLSCFILGSVKLRFMRPRLAGESDKEGASCIHAKPRRVSGILITPSHVVLLKGREDAAMTVARGKFVFAPPSSGRPDHRCIAWCSVLLLFQFIAQLLLVPQGSLFGQIMFVTSLAVSWCYNLWLCSHDKEEIQQKILHNTILGLKKEDVEPYGLKSWLAMVVFVLLTLVLEDEELKEHELKNVLDVLVEDSGEVWEVWKPAVLQQLLNLLHWHSQSPVPEEDFDAMATALEVNDAETAKLSVGDRLKLKALLEEARSGIETFKLERASFGQSNDEKDYDTPFVARLDKN